MDGDTIWALAARVARRWRFVSFRGTGGREWRGIVDVLAIRKDTSTSVHELLRSGDLFDIILIQMKGGSARTPNAVEIQRLIAVARRYHAKEIVLFAWKRGEGCHFFTSSLVGGCGHYQVQKRYSGKVTLNLSRVARYYKQIRIRRSCLGSSQTRGASEAHRSRSVPRQNSLFGASH